MKYLGSNSDRATGIVDIPINAYWAIQDIARWLNDEPTEEGEINYHEFYQLLRALVSLPRDRVRAIYYHILELAEKEAELE